MSTAFLFTPGDGRPTANAFWMGDHAKIIPKVEHYLKENGLKVVWLHSKDEAVCSDTMAVKVGQKLLEEMSSGDTGDRLIPITTGWCWPAHAGIVFTMAQDAIRRGNLQVIHICNMKEKAPGYVGQRANVLAMEILQLSDDCLTIIDQSEAGWAEFATDLKAVLAGNYSTTIPSGPVEVTAEHGRIAREALAFLKKSGGLVRLVNVASMHMYQGWPNLFEFMKLGLTPIFVGSNQFQEEMAKVSQRDINAAYDWLKQQRLNFEYKSGGLTRKEIDLALRMYLVKLGWWKNGVFAMGTQGQMEQVSIVATDLADSLMMSTLSPGKKEPVIDVTEADCEALVSSVLAQAILYVKTGKKLPVGFHDIRHYMESEDTLVLLNSGALALDYMTDTPGDYSDIWAVSQNRRVYFLSGGACVYGNMRPSADNTLFRLHASGPTYTMKAAKMDILPLDWEKRKAVYGELDRWPMGIAKMPDGATKATTLNWTPNHGQHVAEDILPELAAACQILGYGFHCFAK